MTTDNVTYCGKIVRQHDTDRFLASLSVPVEKRPALWALFAFNYEIARTAELVNEQAMGLIRLQWWRDTLRALYKAPDQKPNMLEALCRQHEILPDLWQAIKDFELPLDLFESLTFAREFDLEGRPPETLEGFFHYADFTNTPLLLLAMKILGEEGENPKTIKDIAICYGACGVLRARIFHASQGRDYLPEEMVLSHENDIANVMQEIVGHCLERLKSVKPQTDFMRSFYTMNVIYLKHLKKIEREIESSAAQRRPAFFYIEYILRVYFCK